MPMPMIDAPPPERLLDQLRGQIRYLHYSIRTEDAYVHWVRAYVRFHGLRHPIELGGAEVQSFLAWLATERQVSASTHKQALSALLFLYQQVLGQQLPWMDQITRPRSDPRLPVVLSHEEVAAVLTALDDADWRLFGQLLYGTGLRLLEGLRLRVKDIDFERRAIVVREGKGSKDRVVMLPQSLEQPLRRQLAAAHAVWAADRSAGVAGVQLPHALARKYPRAPLSWAWFWVFPQASLSNDPRGEGLRRHHQPDQAFQRVFKRAVLAAGLHKPASPHTLRHYSESRNMPRHPWRWSRAASGKTGGSLGICSPATLRGVTGDDRDSDIRGSTGSGGRWLVRGVGAAPCRADACSRICAGVGEELDRPCAGLRELARPARDLRPNCRGQAC